MMYIVECSHYPVLLIDLTCGLFAIYQFQVNVLDAKNPS